MGGVVEDVVEVGVGDDPEGLVVGDDTTLVVPPRDRSSQASRMEKTGLNTLGFFFSKPTWANVDLCLEPPVLPMGFGHFSPPPFLSRLNDKRIGRIWASRWLFRL